MPKQTPAKNEPGPLPAVDLQDIFDNAPIGIFTPTPECRYTSVNPALARMFGYDSPEELIDSNDYLGKPVRMKDLERVLEQNVFQGRS